MGHWFSNLYASIDAMQLDEFAAGLAPDVKVVVGNHPAMNGRQAAKEGIGYFFSTIDGIKHHLVNVAESNGLTFLEANVEYLRKDGKTVTIPVVTQLSKACAGLDSPPAAGRRKTARCARSRTWSPSRTSAAARPARCGFR